MKNIKKALIILLLIGGIVTMAACSSEEAAGSGANENGETLTVEHGLGQTTLEKNPENIVIFDYATLDSLDAMGVDVVGLPTANIPEFLEKYNDDKYQDVGTLHEPDFEKIFELDPDIIFISTRQAEAYDQLSEIAPTVYMEMASEDYMGSTTKNLSILGEIFEQEEFVADFLAELETTIEDVNSVVTEDDKNALVVLANDGIISAYGQDSRFGTIHTDFGFTPVDEGIEASTHGQSITFEYVLENDPEYIFVVDRAAVAGGSTSAEELFDNDLIKQTTAYENDNIIYLNAEVWYVAPGGINGTDIMIEDISQVIE